MSDEIKKVVKDAYTNVIANSSCCCSQSACCGDEGVNFSEDYSSLKGHIPEADYGLGCGLPTELARIKEGDTVVDLGSGAGNDAFVARGIVGAGGRVIGIDMTEAMLEKAHINNKKLGYTNVEFVLGDIESMPIEDNISDVVISNCVLNLVPDKKKAFKEIYRILKPGGHFSISDIVIDGSLPESIKEVTELYAGCISGAVSRDEYLNVISEAGFTNVRITRENRYILSNEQLLKFISQEQLDEFRKSNSGIVSVTVYAEKEK